MADTFEFTLNNPLTEEQLDMITISSSLYDGMYYELTYNGDKHEWYLDAYNKFENRCIPSVERKEE